LLEDTKNIEKLLNQRAVDQQSAINQWEISKHENDNIYPAGVVQHESASGRKKCLY
jgi:hypothetical protein